MTKSDQGLVAIAAGLAVIGGYYLLKKSGIVPGTVADVQTDLSVTQQTMRNLIVSLAGANDYGDHAAFLLAEALTESSFNPLAQSSSSFGLFQIQHTAGFSWLRYYGYSDADQPRLFDPTFNTNLAIKIFRYFEKKGFVFPDQADIYNEGETFWAKGQRNLDYQQKVANYTAQFSAWLGA